MGDDDKARQLREAWEIARDCPRCADCGGFLVPLDHPSADFNHRAQSGSNAVAPCCGRGVLLSDDELLRSRRAASAWMLACDLEAAGVRA